MNPVVLAWRNMWRNRRRTILSLVAISMATMTVIMLFAFIDGMKADMSRNLIDFYNGEVELRNDEFGDYEHLQPLHLSVADAETILATLDREPIVSSAVARLGGGGAVFRDEQRIGLQVTGVDFTREERYSEISAYVASGDYQAVVDGRAVGDGAPDADGRGPQVTPAVVGSRVLERMGVAQGEIFTVLVRTAQRSTNAMTFEATAIADFPVGMLNEVAVWVPLERAQRLFQMPGQASQIFAKVAPGTGAEEAVAAITSAVGGRADGLEIRHWSQMETTYSFMELAEFMYQIIGIVFLLLASTVIVNTTMMVIHERRREIGTFAALGMQPGALVRLFFTESLIVGLIGATIGLVAGVGFSALLGVVGIDFGAAMEGVDFEISPVIRPVVNLRSSLLAFGYAIVVTAITTYLPTRRITRIEPVAALRDE